MELNNKNCFISGATGGLGIEIAREFAKKNCNLFLTASKSEKLSKLTKQLKENNQDIKIYYKKGDLTSLNDLKNITYNVKDRMGSIDILINNAGIFPVKFLKDTSIDEYQQCFDINVRAPIFFIKEFAKGMVKKKKGDIVNIISSSAYNGFKKTSIYCASKHALLGFSRSMFQELKDENIRVFSVSPGSIKTNIGRKVENQNYKTFLDPKEISRFVVELIKIERNMIVDEVRLNRMVIK